MKRQSLLAPNFTVSAFADTIFEGFSVKAETPAPSNRKTMKTANEAKANDIINTKLVRPRVPHDFPLEDRHGIYCKGLGSGMITSILGYHPRQKGLFGKSNRIQHLRSLYDELDAYSVCPVYPASYHGTGGEGRPFALGLTEAGCPSSNRTMQVSTTYGDQRIQKTKDHTKNAGN